MEKSRLATKVAFVFVVLGALDAISGERAPWERLPIEQERLTQRQTGTTAAAADNDTGLASSDEEFLAGKFENGESAEGSGGLTWQNGMPYLDPASRKWICPDQDPAKPIKVNPADLLDSEHESEQEVDEDSAAKIAQEHKNFLSLSNAKRLDNLYDKTKFGTVFSNITGIKMTIKPQFHVSIAGAGPTRGVFGARKGPVAATPAFCQPELTTVSLDLDEDPNVFYYPTCVRIERCGGCCSHELLSCQPVMSENVTMTVLKTRLKGDNIQAGGNVQVKVLKHTACKCDCRIKKEDCNSAQMYLSSECRCVCKNADAERTCASNGAQKYWDSNVCKCKCRQVTECSTGLLFDHKTCSCTILESDVVKPLRPYT